MCKLAASVFSVVVVLCAACSGNHAEPPKAIEPSSSANSPAQKSNQVADTQPPSKTTGESTKSSGVAGAGGKTKGLFKELAVDLGGGVKLEMVLIPAGEFMMGWPDSDEPAFLDAKPRHRVRISKPFYLGKYEVTQEQWQAIVGKNPSNFKGRTNPVENVSWDDCQVFLSRLNEKVGGGKVGLPTEAQWEYACRAGSTTKWCFGNSDSVLGEYAWCEENSDGTPHPVGQKKPNAWGLYDMYGNVWEWCQDWFDKGYYGKSPLDDPTGPARGSGRVHRGGGWLADAMNCRTSAFRTGGGPTLRDETLGLRVCRVAVAGDSTGRPSKPLPAGYVFAPDVGTGAEEVVERVDLFQGGIEGYRSYRAPAVVLSNKNTLLAFCEGRRKGPDDGGDIDLLLRRSTDGGKTWQPMRRVYDKEATQIAIGNACPVVDRATGTIWLPFCRNNDQVFVTKSTDDGLTWDKPKEITQQVKKPGWGWYATGPGHGIQLQSGRLVIPCDHDNRDCKPHSLVFYSDDRGQTWKLGGETGRPWRSAKSSNLPTSPCSCPCGDDDGKTSLRAFATSSDGGLSWSPAIHHQQVVCCECQASIQRYSLPPAGTKNRILFSGPEGPRRKMTIRLSYDEGKTWPVAKVLYAGLAAYSDLVVLPDGTIGCVYERNLYRKIAFARFTLGWLTDGKDQP